MNSPHTLRAIVAAALSSLFAAQHIHATTPIYLRVNQVGYAEDDSKLGLALTDESLLGHVFIVVDVDTGSWEFAQTIAADRGPYGSFEHLYELDFTPLDVPGRYRLQLLKAESPEFEIGPKSYGNIIDTSLRFFPVQRCGDTDPSMHGPCHLAEGVSVGGPNDGAPVDVSGGWHDAGDYVQFLGETSAATYLLLLAYDTRPAVFADADENGVPDVLDEARVPLEWILKLWDPDRGVLYYQVSDDQDDHDAWRMPEGDDADPDRPPRKAYACAPGSGANVAGRAAAALALAATLWNNGEASFHDPVAAEAFLETAEELLSFGEANPAVQQKTFEAYETTWQDDMALGAVELFRATGRQDHLETARVLLAELTPAWSLDAGNVHAFAHYRLAATATNYLTSSTEMLATELDHFRVLADAAPFGEALDTFQWGSATAMTARALQARLYEDLTGDLGYRDLADRQRDFVLGSNPWGACFVNGLGSTWSRHPHHRVADPALNPGQPELEGFWNEGPMERLTWWTHAIELSSEDLYAGFQSETAVYHDDLADYATNEPTVIANGFGVAFSAWLAPPLAGSNSTLQFENVGYSGLEGESSIMLSVLRQDGVDANISVRYEIIDGDATVPEDFTASGGLLRWPAGDSRPREIRLEIVDDAIPEAEEGLAVVLYAPSSGARLGTRSQAVVTLTDDDFSDPGCHGCEHGSGHPLPLSILLLVLSGLLSRRAPNTRVVRRSRR